MKHLTAEGAEVLAEERRKGELFSATSAWNSAASAVNFRLAAAHVDLETLPIYGATLRSVVTFTLVLFAT